jgi:DNA-binding LacI/PurR family transcriptional regulator
VDGVIVAGIAADTLPQHELSRLNVVLINQPSPANRYSTVAGDSLAAGRLAAEHLLELEHERIAFIGPPTPLPAFRLRERGFSERLREARVSPRSEYWRRAEASVAGGQAAMRALLELPEPPTAVFCVTDVIALGAHKAAAKAGVRLGAELSLLGCDDIEMNTLVSPELSSIRTPQRELGALAVRELIRQLEGDQTTPTTHILPVKLIKRGTTKALRRT